MPIEVPSVTDLDLVLDRINWLSAHVETEKTGVYVPLYKVANAPALVQVMTRYPTVSVVAAINPPPQERGQKQKRFSDGIAILKAAGASVLYYVATRWGQRPIQEVFTEMEQAAAFYPDIDGFMLDEMSAKAEDAPYYGRIRRKALGLGFDFIKGNPGQIASRAYMTLIDNISIAEGKTLPPEIALKERTFYETEQYPKARFSITIHSQPTLDVEYVKMAAKYVGLMYITSDSGDNPYDELPPYLDKLFETLAGA